jgi:hypothetical protein
MMKKKPKRSGTPKLLAASSRRLLWLLPAVWLNLVPVTTLAATQSVEIGRFTSAGTISLQLPKFQEQFADGTRIAEITVTEYDGNRVVRRKGYSASGDCRVEITPIMNSSGQTISSIFVAPAGTRVFFVKAIPVTLFSCSDDGRCSELVGVGVPDGPQTLSAKCDQTELSDNRCQCHITTTDSTETQVGADDFCHSGLENLWSHLSDWIRLRYIK